MFHDPMFLMALQGSLLLGLIHGVNPCGHSWVVLAPFVVGGASGRRAALLTIAFTGGTALACLVIGLTLGALASAIPPGAETAVNWITGGVLVLLGAVLVINPDLLHSHGECSAGTDKLTMAGLFGLGFVNMIVPCPTVAIMYSYAVGSGSAWQSTAVFGAYALATAATLSVVILAIWKVSSLMHRLQKEWIEDTLMRGAGVLTAAFGAYSLIAGH